MKVKVIAGSLLRHDGRRLDCGPYMSGALEAKIKIAALGARKERLLEVTTGPHGGIFRPPIFGMQFARALVESPEHGVPFVTGSSMLLADLSHLPLVSIRVAHQPRYKMLELQPGMTLVSCSGSIGRTTYARRTMAGIWSSQAVMKINSDPRKIPPGYVYAFLSGRYGQALVTQKTYGALVPQVEREHLIDIPVPRLEAVEQRAHELVEHAAELLARYSELIGEATARLLDNIGIKEASDYEWHSNTEPLGWSESSLTTESLRARNYDPRIQNFRRQLSGRSSEPLGSLCDPKLFKGKIIFRRIDVAPEHGELLVGQRTAFQLRPDGRWISRRSVDDYGLRVPAFTTLIPSHGTLGEFELYCRALLVTPRMARLAFSGDFFRCVPRSELVHPGYLFAFLRSRLAFRMLRSISTGGKQQEQHPDMMWRLPVPRLRKQKEEVIGLLVEDAATRLDRALDAEDAARRLVEDAIEKGSN